MKNGINIKEQYLNRYRKEEKIINISNDYWSLTETEGKQHFMSGMMRAVENRKPLARSTASGLTGVVERTGKIRDTQPFYKPLYVNTQIRLYNDKGFSIYTKYGDWFSALCIAVVSFIFIKSIIFRITRRDL